jgi:hypothetical protein
MIKKKKMFKKVVSLQTSLLLLLLLHLILEVWMGLKITIKTSLNIALTECCNIIKLRKEITILNDHSFFFINFISDTIFE